MTSLLHALLRDPHPFNVWIAWRTDGLRGSGTRSDPYNGSTVDLFDAIMASLPTDQPVRVHLGPSPRTGSIVTPFQTRGFVLKANGSPGGSAWEPRPGMAIAGSGVDVTCLQLLPGTSTNCHYFAIGAASTTLLDLLDVSDLTIDCNLSGQPANVAAGAIRVKGNHARIRLVKAVGWGTRTTAKPCHVIAALTGDAAKPLAEIFDTVIEDCLAVERDSASHASGIIVVLHIGGHVDGSVFPEPVGESAVIRNCIVDGGAPVVDLTRDIRALSVSWCHGAIIENNQIRNVRHGGPFQNAATVREVIVSQNLYRNVFRGPYFKATLWPTPVDLDSLTRNSPSAGMTTAKTKDTSSIATAAANLPRAGDRLKITWETGGTPASEFVEVTAVDTANNKFSYPSPASGDADSPAMQKVMGVDKLLIEQNIFELADGTQADPNAPVAIQLDDGSVILTSPPYAHGQVVLRDNIVRYAADVPVPDSTGYACNLKGVAHLFIRKQFIDVIPEEPVKTAQCGTVTCFENRNPDGELLTPNDPVALQILGDLDGDAAGAVVTAAFRK